MTNGKNETLSGDGLGKGSDGRHHGRMHPPDNLSPSPPVLSFEKDESSGPVIAHLLKFYGPLLDMEALAQVLRYPSTGALERSLQRGHLQLSIVRVPHRRGSFALATDVANFLMSLKIHAEANTTGVDASEAGKERRDLKN